MYLFHYYNYADFTILIILFSFYSMGFFMHFLKLINYPEITEMNLRD